MNETQTLNVLQSGKVELGNNYLKLGDNVSDDELREIFKSLVRCKDSTLFWIGDFLLNVELTRGEAYAKAFEETDYSYGTLRNAKMVSKRFPPDKRFNLTYSHHFQALGECNSKADLASKFLQTAEEDNLSVSAMRKQIRLSLKEKNIEDNAPALPSEEITFYQVLDAINTIIRYFKSVSSNELAIKKNYIKGEIERLFTIAEKKLK